MQTAVEQVRTMLDTLPEDATLEDIQYHLYVIQKVEQGLRDVEEGRIISHEDLVKEVRSWQSR